MGKFSSFLGLPDSVSGFKIEMQSNSEIVIDGSTGVAEYDGAVIKVPVKRQIISIYGRALHITYLGQSECVIKGVIEKLEFS